MPLIETTAAFFGLSLLLGFSPGPDNLYVFMQSVANGRKAGLFVLLGLCTGLVIHTAAVTLGLAAVFAASVSAFVVLKYLGAAYLAYLAWQAYRAPDYNPAQGTVQALPYKTLYLRGTFMNLTNPKVVLFFLAFLPQFVDPKIGSVALQLSWFGFVFIIATLLSFGTITYMAAIFKKLLGSSATAQRLMNHIVAIVFVGFALRLALSER